MGKSSDYSSPKAESSRSPKAESPKAESPKAGSSRSPKAESPKAESPKAGSSRSPKAESPKTESSRSPKAESPKADFHDFSSYDSGDDSSLTASQKARLNNIKNLFFEYVDVCADLDKAMRAVVSLQRKKAEMEAKLAEDPEFGKLASTLASISDLGGPKR